LIIMMPNCATLPTKVASIDQLAALSRERPVWLRVGQLFDGLSTQMHRDVDVVFDAREIRFVGHGGQTPDCRHLFNGQSEPDLTLAEHALLPCLIEAHAHLFLDGAPIEASQREQYLKQPAASMLARARARWAKILQTGVGAVRDAGDRHGVGLALAAEAKTRLGELATTPWIDSPGAAIHHRGRYGSFMGEPLEDFESWDACVAGRVAAGADRIKLLVSGIINFQAGRVTTPPQMSAEEVGALVNAARQHGRQTFAHASGAGGIENAIEGGVTTVEHGFFITEEQLAKMRDRGIGWVPTFAPVQLQIDRAEELGWNETVVGNLRRIINGHHAMLRRAYEMGVTVIVGSDAGSCGVPHGLGLLDELQHMERAGVRPVDVLRSATGTSASLLEFAEPIGRIAPGCRARFILTEHDPLATVANLRLDKSIVFDGTALCCDGKLCSDGL
jgi:imidazolonepropionase-like amidohydrolase